MDPAEIRLIRYIVIGAEVFKKIRSSSNLWEPLKLCLHHVQSSAVRLLIANCAARWTPLWLRLWFYIIQGLTIGQWKYPESVADCQINFFDRHLSFFTCKSYNECSQICKLCKDCLTSMGLTKRPHFLSFQMPKAEQRLLRTCQLWRASSLRSLDRQIYDWKLLNEKI
jgi:hypothetical protein